MNIFKPSLRLIALIGLVLLFTACSVAPASPTATLAPTQDIPALHTLVAQTVVAELTVQAALHPSPTPLPKDKPTDPPPTLIPSFTPNSVLASPLATLRPTTAATAVWVVQPTFTKTPYTDSCTLQSTDPADYTVMSPGENFEASWNLKNTGMRPWNTEFYFAKVKGTLGGTYNMGLANPVTEGNVYNLRIAMVAPNDPGNYNGTYKLINDDGTAICQFFVAITVK